MTIPEIVVDEINNSNNPFSIYILSGNVYVTDKIKI